jgi:hypothetical protein
VRAVRRAAIAAEMRAIGLEPAGDDGYLQTVPLSRVSSATDDPDSMC